MDTVHYRFNSWDKFLDFAEKSEEQKHLNNHSFGRDADGDCGGFYQTSTWADGLKLARDGWAAKVHTVRELSQPILDKVTSLIERPELVYDVEGSQIDIGRFLDGEPECWQAFQPTIVEGTGNRIVRIAANTVVSGAHNESAFLAVGVSLCALIEALEIGGIRCEVTALYPCTFSHDADKLAIDARVIVKEPDQPIDMARLMFAFAHPSSSRRLGFNFAGLQDAARQRAISASFGHCYPESTCEKYFGTDYDIVIAGLPYELFGKDNNKKIAWVMDHARKMGLQLAED